MSDDGLTVHERRRQRDREAAAARRAESKASGVPMGHSLDALIVEGVALMLEGRDAGDPVRMAYMRAQTRACHARRVVATRTLGTRLQARLSVSSDLRQAIIERSIEAIDG